MMPNSVTPKYDYDVAIIGGGPAGLTAAIYLGRANLKSVFIEKDAPGGKMVKTATIENWSGDEAVRGSELAMRMFNHAQKITNNTYKYGDVVKIKSLAPHHHEVHLNGGEIITVQSVIIASGMVERVPMQVINIQKFENRGVSYCVICDGPLFKGQEIAIIGGGNSAIGEAAYAANFAKHVHVFVRKSTDLVAEQKNVTNLKKLPNVTVHLDAEILELIGKDKVEKIKARIGTNTVEMPIKAVFPYIGHVPATSFVKDLNITNPHGFIKTDEDMQTAIPGLYAAGDVREKTIRQISTAVADGTIAGKLIADRIKR